MRFEVDRDAVREVGGGLYEPEEVDIYAEVRARYDSFDDLFDNPSRFGLEVKTFQHGLSFGLGFEDVDIRDTEDDLNSLSLLDEEWEGEIENYGFKLVYPIEHPTSSKVEYESPEDTEEAISVLEKEPPTLIFSPSSSTGLLHLSKPKPVQVNYRDGTFHLADHPYSERGRTKTVRRLEETLKENGLDYEVGELFVSEPGLLSKAYRNPSKLVEEMLEQK